MTDNINPDHYAFGGMQPWEYLKIKLSPEALKGFYLGNYDLQIIGYQVTKEKNNVK